MQKGFLYVSSKAILMGVEVKNKMEVRSLRKGGPVRRQSFKLGCSHDWRQLQSYTILMGVVGEFFLTA